jgi:hypothetical protein
MKIPLLILIYIENNFPRNLITESDTPKNEANSIIKLQADQVLY